MKYRDKLSRPMAGLIPLGGGFSSPEDYKGRRALKSCHSEFHHILWCGQYRKPLKSNYQDFSGFSHSVKPIAKSSIPGWIQPQPRGLRQMPYLRIMNYALKKATLSHHSAVFHVVSLRKNTTHDEDNPSKTPTNGLRPRLLRHHD